jgi:hypothetical protein
MLNLIFIFIAGALAHIVPSELMLVAYALLGPAHYLTEISWLHDRKYFADKSWFAGSVVLGTVLIGIFHGYWDIYIWSVISLALATVLIQNIWFRIFFLLISFGVYNLLYQPYTKLSLILMLLLPTIIHVFIFTLMFIMKGAVQQRERIGFLSIAAIFLVSASFFLLPFYSIDLFPNWTTENLKQISGIWIPLGKALNLYKIVNLNSLFKFVAFAYTFHYLNWFSKTGYLGWHKVSRFRIIFLISMYFIFFGIYIYNYKVGLKALYFLSILHVVLEFPLNIITGRSLLGSLFYFLKKRILGRIGFANKN